MNKIISVLKNKIEEVKRKGKSVKTIYCTSHFLSKIKTSEEYFEEKDMHELIVKGIFGKVFSIDVVATSYLKNRIIFSSEKHTLEKVKDFKFDKETLEKVKVIEARSKKRMEDAKILELLEKEIIGVEE